jgi:2,4-dienoyl-CoA reductase-like NADH-dependent reductase (Old Yellow Enzyme family)/thioredoxin reductase
MLMLGRDEVRPSLVKVADAIHAHGALANIEISHGGAMADPAYNGGHSAIGPCGYIDAWGDKIIQMDEEMMDDVAEAFAEAAVTVRDCGFDMVMIHCGHGWLLSQFLSPLYNKRTDQFGGSMENRARFPLMVIDRIRQRVGRTLALDMRISGSEFLEGGMEIGDCIAFCKMVEDRVDMINVSAGAPWTKRMSITCFEERGINSEFSMAVKEAVTKIPVTSVGGYTDPELMEQFLEEGRADAFVLGRSILADPQLPTKARTGKADQIHRCLRCAVCNQYLYHKGRVLHCSINPFAGREREIKYLPPALTHQKVLVAGGGPAGMEAAITAARRGHEVTLYEKSSTLGGALNYLQSIPFKQDLPRFAKALIAELDAAGVTVHMKTPLTKTIIDKEKPDLVIAAIGAEPLIPNIKGIDLPNVMLATELYRSDTEVGARVVIIGGGLVGCEDGLNLAMEGHQVTILEMQDEVAPDAAPEHRKPLLFRLENETVIACGIKVTEVTLEGVKALGKDGQEQFFPADTVVLAAGFYARAQEAESLRGTEYEFRVVGDCRKPRKIMDAVREGCDAALYFG